MFTDAEINLMKKIGLDADFQNLDRDDDYWCTIEDKVGDYLTLHCLDENYYPNADGIICEAILDKLPIDE